MSSASDLASDAVSHVRTDAGSLQILVASADAALVETIERTCVAERHRFLSAADVADALAIGAKAQPDLAFVDVSLEGGAGLALVHHLPAVCPALVYAIVPPLHIEFGSQSMALGAAGILIAPPSGDGLLLAMGEVRQRREAKEETARLHSELAAWKRRTELVERVARLADGGDRTTAALAIAEALAEASRASGVAIYSVDGESPDGTRLAAVGSAALLDGDGVAQARAGVRVLTLALGGRTVGYALLDNASVLEGDAMRPLLEMASAVLSAGQPRSPASSHEAHEPAAWSRVYTLDQFKDTASREIDRAKRHGRRLVIGVILVSGARESFMEQALLDALRESDVLANGPPGEYWLLLPETTAIGALACRRRVLRLASPESGRVDADRPPAELGAKLSIGIAAYPHDGNMFQSLEAKAKARALDARKSIVLEPSTGTASLADLIDSLLAVPRPANGMGSPGLARVELPPGALASLSEAACREALRGGTAMIFLAFQENSRTLDTVRAMITGRDATLHAVDARRFDRCANAEALVAVAQHGTWTMCARFDGTRTRVAHSADPLLADVVAQKLAKVSSVRLG